ncbi:PepSY-associated TM helix domain-containing protein [Ravibacter arvi]|uniref:PepSY-associated TM helix domain-containing protein n=1 Tax=Ravibacter arvi TaxID=2051041 RepID=A0ABP8M3S9_9BACT
MEKPVTLTEKRPVTVKPEASRLRRFNDWFHLWVGIASGIPVIIISLTGALLVFEHEILEMSRSWWKVEIPADATPLPPSVIRSRVAEQLPEMKVRRLWYYGEGRPVKITPDNSDSLIFVSPYTGRVLALEDHENVFEFIEEGHFHLWLPDKIGTQVVSWSTAVFFFLLVTGMVLWWPKKWSGRDVKQAFTIKWKARFKRINYDLHNVLGFYTLSLAVIMAFTGLMMGFAFFNKSVLKMLGGQDGSPEVTVIDDGPETVPATLEGKVDHIWKLVTTEMGEFEKDQISIHFPKEDGKFIYACTDMYHGTWRELYFDIHTLALLSTSQSKIAEDTPANWLRRSNFSLHVGAFGGLLTKWLFFFASLVCATLPVTGFYIWWGKRRKKPGKKGGTRLRTVKGR